MAKIYTAVEKERILEALKTIKEVCINHPQCVGCPFYDENICLISNEIEYPEAWEINEEKENWRALL